jgi:hypothetical protein
MQVKQKLSDIANAIIGHGRIDAEQVKEIRLEIFSESRIIERMLEDGIVDRDEAELLFSINDALTEANYDDSWHDLFVEAITSHVLKDEISPGALDEEEARFILTRVQRDENIRPIELDLLINISASINSAPVFFQSFVLAALKEHVLRDGSIDERDARMIRGVLLGSGSSSGKTIDDAERDWLRGLDALTAQEKNHPSWNLLKLEAGLGA